MDWQYAETHLSRLAPPFPREAVEEARRRWDEWGPHFIAVIERVAAGESPYCEDEDSFDGLFCFATWLAAEKRDTRAYAPLVRACHCSAERAEMLFADDLTNALGRMLASMCDGDLAPLKALAEDANAAMWCRYAALFAMMARVIEGDDARDTLLAWLEDFCVREAERMRQAGVRYEDESDDLLTWAVDIVAELGPAPLIEQIRAWFAEGLIDPQVRGLSAFERLAGKSADACLDKARQSNFNRYVDDAVAGMEWWACFQEEPGEPDDPAWLDRAMPAVGGQHLIHGEGTFKRDIPKVGRNDSCPCGSGKKFKKCCGQESQDHAEAGNGSSAVQRSIDWLMRHRENDMREAVRDMLREGLDEEDEEALAGLDEETWRMIQTNLLEGLLAEGMIFDDDLFELVSVPALLLAQNGPPLSASERRWIDNLASHPLRLYEVTETVPGARMTLCDALDLEAPPIVVEEKSGSRMARVGMRLGARILPVGNHHELSGAVYPFSGLHTPALMDELRQDMEEFSDDYPEELPDVISGTIRRHWLLQYLRPAPLPTVVDTHSGDLLLFISDRYRVRNWPVLAQVLEAQKDIDGNREGGWSRLIECDDGLIRRRMSIEPADVPDVIEVSYKTQAYADEGRLWIESLAGEAVEFLGRDIKDPKVAMMLGGLGEKRPAPPADLPPEALAEIIETTLRRSYARWADEPLPALGNKTPRTAIKTAAGLERVKGLLRSYQEGEKRQAAEQGRREISYDFLWDALGLHRT
jgi:hypothetical protein